MSLHYDESRPSPLQRQYAQTRRSFYAKISAMAATQPKPIKIQRPVSYWPPSYWALDCDWSILIPALEGHALENKAGPLVDEIYTIREIQDAVCRAAKVGRNDLLSSRRSHNIVNPRHIAIALSKILTLNTLTEIGRQFNHKDHSTVYNSIRKMGPVMEEIEWVIATSKLPKIAMTAFQVCTRIYPPGTYNTWK